MGATHDLFRNRPLLMHLSQLSSCEAIVDLAARQVSVKLNCLKSVWHMRAGSISRLKSSFLIWVWASVPLWILSLMQWVGPLRLQLFDGSFPTSSLPQGNISHYYSYSSRQHIDSSLSNIAQRCHRLLAVPPSKLLQGGVASKSLTKWPSTQLCLRGPLSRATSLSGCVITTRKIKELRLAFPESFIGSVVPFRHFQVVSRRRRGLLAAAPARALRVHCIV